MLTVLLYISRSLSKDLLGDFGKALKKIDPESYDSLSENKSRLIKDILHLHPGLKIISKTPTARAYELVVATFDPKKDFSVKYKSTKDCVKFCQTRNDGDNNISIFHTPERKKDKVIKNVNELIQDYFHPSGKCRVCGNPKKFIVECENPPLIIAVDPASSTNFLPAMENISVLGNAYTLFAVAYNKEDNHFIALIKFDGKILKYDGLTDDGRLSNYDNDKFSSYLENTKVKAVLYWYRRLII